MYAMRSLRSKNTPSVFIFLGLKMLIAPGRVCPDQGVAT